VIQLSQTGVSLSFAREELSSLAERFTSDYHITLPQLIAPDLLTSIARRLESSSFAIRVYEGLGQDLYPEDARLGASLNFLCNNRKLFDFIQQVTACGQLGCFVGKVYRMAPDASHYDSWHDDNVDDRRIAMSINLTMEPYTGGTLEIRDSQSRKTLKQIENFGFGDAVVFPITEGLEHRRTPVSGSVAKTAFAGWFKSKPDFREVLARTTKELDLSVEGK
jgi:hypothetical protein